MAISLYGDESESRDPHVFTLAGFIASPSAWERFAPAWREMLSSTGPYPVDSFHANLIDKGNPPFDGWTISEREALVSRAIAILADTTICANLYAIGCTFVLADLDETLPGAVGRGRSQDIYEHYYRVLFHNLLKFSPFKGVDFIFDEKAKVSGRVKEHFANARTILDRDEETTGRLNECQFCDDRKEPPLQAADLLAFELRRRAWDRVRQFAAAASYA